MVVEADTGTEEDGSGYINTIYLKNAATVTSIHTGNGECKITLLSE